MISNWVWASHHIWFEWTLSQCNWQSSVSSEIWSFCVVNNKFWREKGCDFISTRKSFVYVVICVALCFAFSCRFYLDFVQHCASVPNCFFPHCVYDDKCQSIRRASVTMRLLLPLVSIFMVFICLSFLIEAINPNITNTNSIW